MEETRHPAEPRSNVIKIGTYDPDKYVVEMVSPTLIVDEAQIPNRPPCLTQKTVGKYLQPTTNELQEVWPRPTFVQLPVSVKTRMLERDKAFWVDKPEANAYSIHDAFHRCQLVARQVRPVQQVVFPRSYQYDVECVEQRWLHGCDGLKQTNSDKKLLRSHCRDCTDYKTPGLTPFQLQWAKDPGSKRWRYYPDLHAKLSKSEISSRMRK